MRSRGFLPACFGFLTFGQAVQRRAVEIRSELLASVRLLYARDLFGCALGDDAAAFSSAFGAEIEDPIGVADHVHVVLDDDNRVAEVGQAMQHVEQFADVVEVQSGGGLVEQVESLAGLALAEFAGELDALRFASGERDGGLTEVNVSRSEERRVGKECRSRW